MYGEPPRTIGNEHDTLDIKGRLDLRHSIGQVFDLRGEHQVTISETAVFVDQHFDLAVDHRLNCCAPGVLLFERFEPLFDPSDTSAEAEGLFDFIVGVSGLLRRGDLQRRWHAGLLQRDNLLR
jgi:hypothetical protein